MMNSPIEGLCYIASSSGHTSFYFNMPWKLDSKDDSTQLLSDVWMWITYMYFLNVLMEIHSNLPILYYVH